MGSTTGDDERDDITSGITGEAGSSQPIITPAVLPHPHGPAGVFMAAAAPGILAATPVMRPPVSLEAVGVPISSEMFQGFQPVPQPAMHPTGIQPLPSLQPEIPGAAAVSLIPQPGVSTVPAGHVGVDPNKLELTHCSMGSETGNVDGEAEDTNNDTGRESGFVSVDGGHVTIPLTTQAGVCVPPMNLAAGAPSAIPSGITSDIKVLKLQEL